MRRAAAALLAVACVVAVAPPAVARQAPVRQTQEDDYTRYELLGPDTAQFRILYDVTATTPWPRSVCVSVTENIRPPVTTRGWPLRVHSGAHVGCPHPAAA